MQPMQQQVEVLRTPETSVVGDVTGAGLFYVRSGACVGLALDRLTVLLGLAGSLHALADNELLGDHEAASAATSSASALVSMAGALAWAVRVSFDEARGSAA